MNIDSSVKYIDLWFTDLLGRLKHVTISRKSFEKYISREGVIPKLDGSSIRGFSDIHDSDMLLIPDLRTIAKISDDTARVICTTAYRGKKENFKDPRWLAIKAEEKLMKMGYKAYFGPELEFFVFNNVSLKYIEPWYQMVKISSKEAPWNGNGEVIHHKDAYYAGFPYDKTYTFRKALVEYLEENFGIEFEAHHHEVATAGQVEIDITKSTLVDMADKVITLKYAAKVIANKMGMIATFMPKPVYGDNGSGMHTHVSIWSDGKNLFHDASDEYAGLSDFARYFIGGLLEHARAISAIVSPTVNSYRRLVPGYEAPVYLVWSKSNRSAAVRIPAYEIYNHDSKRVEYRPPDPSSNPYLAFIAIVAAGLDGVRRKIDPGDPVDENVYEMGEVKRKELGIKELPATLKEALDELENDNEFLREFIPRETIEVYIELKRREYIEVTSRPSVVDYYFYLTV